MKTLMVLLLVLLLSGCSKPAQPPVTQTSPKEEVTVMADLTEKFTPPGQLLPEQGAGAGRSKDLVKSGNMIYTIGDGKFTVTDASDPANPKVLGSISGLAKYPLG